MKIHLLLMLAFGFCGVTEAADFDETSADKAGASRTVWFQAHRGGLREVPENTAAAFVRTWRMGGVPEADIRTTSDDVIICLHDSTLKRTTNAPNVINGKDVSKLTFQEIQKWDAGGWFDQKYKGEKVPALTEVFEAMRGQPKRQIYLDLKDVDLDKLGELIAKFGIGKQIIFCHNRQKNLIRFRGIAPDVRTMLWIGGKPDEIKEKFKRALDSGFDGLDQVQLHLHRPEGEEEGVSYLLEAEYLSFAIKKTKSAGIELEVLPFEFDDTSLNELLDLGIRWYATDYPERFVRGVAVWKKTSPVSERGN